MIHLHNDIESIQYFVDRNGNCAYSSRIIAYSMQNEHIVGVFYTTAQAIAFYENNYHKENLPIIYFYKGLTKQ